MAGRALHGIQQYHQPIRLVTTPMNTCHTCQQPIVEGRGACPQDPVDASRPNAAAPLSGEPPAPNAAFHGVLARGVTHPQIHVDYYAWLASLPEFDRRFMATANPHGIAMWAWSRSRETLNEAAKAKHEPTT